jgi:Leucine-rich repeat (LRR) protein
MNNSKKIQQVKISFKNEIKRANIPQQLTDLVLLAFKIFNIKDDNGFLEIRYADNEGDNCMISNQYDYEQAIDYFEKEGKETFKVNVIQKSFDDFGMDTCSIPDENDMNNTNRSINQRLSEIPVSSGPAADIPSYTYKDKIEKLNISRQEIEKEFDYVINDVKNEKFKKILKTHKLALISGNISKLDLNKCDISGQDLQILKDFDLSNLKRLFLSNNKISPIDVCYLKDINLTNLEELSFYNNQIGDKGLSFLKECSLPKLRILYLASNII